MMATLTVRYVLLGYRLFVAGYALLGLLALVSLAHHAATIIGGTL